VTARAKIGRARSPLTVLSLAAGSFFLTISFSIVLNPSDFGLVAAFGLALALVSSAIRAVFAEQVLVATDREQFAGLTALTLFTTATAIVTSGAILQSLGQFHLFLSVLPFVLFAGSDPIRYVRLAQQDSLSLVQLPGIDMLRGCFAFAACLVASHGGSVTAVQGVAIAVGAMGFITDWRGAGPTAAWRYLRSRGAFERLVLIQFVVSIGVGQLLPTMAIGAFGTAAFGQIRLAQTYVGPAATIASALQPGLIRGFVRSERDGVGRGNVARTVGIMFSVGLVITGLVLAVATFFGGPSVPDTALLLAAGSGGLVAIAGQPGGALIRVRRLGAVSLGGQVIGALVGFGLAVSTIQLGAHLFAWSLAGYTAATVVATYILLFIYGHREARAQGPHRL
jgi:hypothetical protein